MHHTSQISELNPLSASETEQGGNSAHIGHSDSEFSKKQEATAVKKTLHAALSRQQGMQSPQQPHTEQVPAGFTEQSYDDHLNAVTGSLKAHKHMIDILGEKQYVEICMGTISYYVLRLNNKFYATPHLSSPFLNVPKEYAKVEYLTLHELGVRNDFIVQKFKIETFEQAFNAEGENDPNKYSSTLKKKIQNELKANHFMLITPPRDSKAPNLYCVLQNGVLTGHTDLKGDDSTAFYRILINTPGLQSQKLSPPKTKKSRN